MGPVAALLPCGKRLHLHHGPIDLIIGADGDRTRAFDAARARFETVLSELVGELDALRMPMSPLAKTPDGETAQRMHFAASGFAEVGYLTRMAAVAGAVADTVLAAMTDGADLRRAYVNNGGDIAIHLGNDATFATAMMGHDGRDLGRIKISARDPIRGIATSGRHGRSHSLGIADSVTVLAKNAAMADVAATLIANAVDLPGHHAITRRAADDMTDDSDLGDIPVVTHCGPLSHGEKCAALQAGARRAAAFLQDNRIQGASLHLQGEAITIGGKQFAERRLEHV